MKKLPNLESTFLINDTSILVDTLILSTKTFKMMINLSKVVFSNSIIFYCLKSKTNQGKGSY